MASSGPANDDYTWSYQAGTTDVHGNLMGGTELMCLAGHKGSLYAGVGYWEDTQGNPGPQILRLDSSKGNWVVDLPITNTLLDGSREFTRVAALQEFTFNYDSNGKALNPPVTLLLAGCDNLPNTHQAPTVQAPFTVFVRNDRTGGWTSTSVTQRIGYGVRAFGFLPSTGEGHPDYVFAQEFIRGSYNSTTGSLDWSSPGEPSNPPTQNRSMCFAEFNGNLYASVKPNIYVYKETNTAQFPNGANTGWWDCSNTYPDLPSSTGGVRGLVAMPEGFLMGVLEADCPDAQVYHFPSGSKGWVISELLQKLTGCNYAGHTSDIIASYNNTLQVTDPTTGEAKWLVGLGGGVIQPRGDAGNSWFLSRTSKATWNAHMVPNLGFQSNEYCVSIRCMAVSPFPEDNKQVLFLGFYDTYWQLCHNTAHVFRVGLATALKPYSPNP
jgi:hypothetical protein